MKKQMFAVAVLCLALAGIAMAKNEPPAMPGVLANARFVYVTSYDGNQYNPNILPEDREAIGRVQDELQKWGKLTLVYRAEDADIIMAVQARGSEDVLAVYDAHSTSDTYLWRVMGRGGLQKGETPLLTQFQKAFEKIAKK
jgi:hypothetical protein